jgi:hypothetical protein
MVGRNYRLQDIQLFKTIFDIVWDDPTFAPHGATVGKSKVARLP